MGKKKANNKGSKVKQSFHHQTKQKNNRKIKKVDKIIRGKDNLINMKSKDKNNKIKGNSLFQIIPQGPGMDKFAALGYEDQEQEIQQQQLQNNEYQVDSEEQFQMQNGQQINEYDDENFNQNQQFQGQGNWDQQIEQQQQGNEEQFQQQEDIEDDDGQQGQQQQKIIKMNLDDDDNEVDLSVIKMRIQQTLAILLNIARLGQGNSRTFFIQKLRKYIHRYYGYNFQLIDHFFDFLNPHQMIMFLQANQTQRPLTIRTNTLKTRRKQLAQSLIQRGVNLDPLADWSNVGIKIYDTKVPIGATPQYLAGQYMLQSASSFLPVLALDVKMNQKVLDLASAPGGKTTYIAQLMKNTGSIFANDLKKDRLKALQYNLYRLGITNTVVTCRDGRKYPEIFPNTFDKVLLDSPCTGLGIISKDHSIKANRLQIDIYKNSHIQKELIVAAIDCTKVGGTIVYSTCSVSPLENEEVVNYALKKRHVKVVNMDDLVPVGQQGLTKFIDKRYFPSLKNTRRIYPHVHNMDGFYVAKLIKMQNGKKVSKQMDSGQKNKQ